MRPRILVRHQQGLFDLRNYLRTYVWADAAFRPLADWLRERRIDPDELQTGVDAFLEQARLALPEQE